MNLAAYLLLFVVVGVGFILVHLLAGKVIRPSSPGAEKGTIYECGEPTIGSAWVQFDLRFYVVALLFVIFDVEVAFFFPWAEVFGRANAVAAHGPGVPAESQLKDYGQQVNSLVPPFPGNEQMVADYGNPETLADRLAKSPHEAEMNATAARTLAVLALGEILVFFGVLLVGFAYLWRRGDLEWVRSLAERSGKPTATSLPLPMAPVKTAPAPSPVPAATAHAH
jgi:NADH-quinone oxidoreductase subunit A